MHCTFIIIELMDVMNGDNLTVDKEKRGPPKTNTLVSDADDGWYLIHSFAGALLCLYSSASLQT